MKNLEKYGIALLSIGALLLGIVLINLIFSSPDIKVGSCYKNTQTEYPTYARISQISVYAPEDTWISYDYVNADGDKGVMGRSAESFFNRYKGADCKLFNEYEAKAEEKSLKKKIQDLADWRDELDARMSEIEDKLKEKRK